MKVMKKTILTVMMLMACGMGMQAQRAKTAKGNATTQVEKKGVQEPIAPDVVAKAKAGDAKAQALMSRYYRAGERGVRKNPAEAFRWAKLSADQGSPFGKYELACCYELGLDVDRSPYQAQSLYEQAFEGLTQLASASKDAHAQFYLGSCYLYGDGTTQSYANAINWYGQASEQGHAMAQGVLGYLYEKGQGAEQSYAEAMRLYLLAAQQNDVFALQNLGGMYANGRGVACNEAEAMKWYKRAAELGGVQAMHNLGWMYQNGNGTEVNYTEAMKWYTLASELGFAPSQTNIGKMYADGIGVAKNDATAISWYKKAAAGGDKTAVENLRARGISGY